MLMRESEKCVRGWRLCVLRACDWRVACVWRVKCVLLTCGVCVTDV